MVLVNGANGIATGFRTSILPYRLTEIIQNLKRKLRGGKFLPMKPHVNGFKGVLTTEYVSTGVYGLSKVASGTCSCLTVTELPLGTSIVQYKTFLSACPNVTRYDEYHADENSVHFKIYGDLDVSKMKLTVQHTKSFYLLDQHKCIKKYDSEIEILEDFYAIRMDVYAKRKKHILQSLQQTLNTLNERILFIKHVLEHGFSTSATGWDANWMVFMRLPISSLTASNISDSRTQMKTVRNEMIPLRKMTVRALYEHDLDHFMKSIKSIQSKKRKR